jgi:WhiB family transcriptional regulator, redox-sensing transcriptional regulator
MSRQPAATPAYHASVGDDGFLTAPDLACTHADPELFFQDGHGLDAKDICNRCPALDACRDYAVVRPWLYGIWGGTSLKQRQKIRQKRMGQRQ